MAQDLNVRDFFRRAPQNWLRRYFEKEGVFPDIDWLSIRSRNIEPLMNACLDLNEDLRGRMADDFNAINLLATPAGKVQIIDEAVFHKKQQEVAAKLAELSGLYECAFWTFLEQPECFKGAVFFAEADGKPRRQWRKRVNMPQLGRSSTAADGQALEEAIVELFRRREGRGDHCVIEQYRRGAHGEKEYYFAYPQDHRQMALEYSKGQMTRRPHRPAFEIIFLLDDGQRTLSIWHRGKKERIADLQVAFAKAVLGCNISAESPRDDRVYDLHAFLDPGFVFRPRPELGIASAVVRKISVRVLGVDPHSISIDLGATTPGPVLCHRLTAVTHGIPKSKLKVARIDIRVTFDLEAGETKQAVRDVALAWPNFCNLENDRRDNLIQRMLADHGIEPARHAEQRSDPDGARGA